MKSGKNSYWLLLSIGLLILLGCNWSERETQNEPKPDESSETAAGETKDTPDDDFDIKTEDEATEESSDDKETDDSAGPNRSRTTIVKFAKRKTSRSYNDAVIRAESHTYILGASKGQNMLVKVSSLENNAVFRVRTPSGRFLGKATDEEGTTQYNGILPASGNYRITVTPTRGNATYKITFTVSAKRVRSSNNSTTVESVGGLTTVVKFRKGATSATYRNAVLRAQRNTYILGAGGGQIMNIRISSLESNAVFTVRTPNGRTLASGTKAWGGRLPANGRYRILVSPTRGNATYTITFAVR